jgi:cytochrome c
MSKTDPGWIYIIIILAVIGLLWKPVIMPVYNKVARNFSKEDQIAAGKEIFNDDKRWGNQGISCATCHSEGQKPPAVKAAKLIEFKYVPLTGVYYRYTKGAMGNDQEIANKINICVTTSTRLASPNIAPTSDAMKNLIYYLQSLK